MILLLIPLVMSCDSDSGINPQLQGIEEPLVKAWTYESVVYQQDTVIRSEPNFEPGEATSGAFRDDLLVAKRHIEYAPNQTYLLFWDREGGYELSDSVHFQPNIGFWIIRGDSLIHNPTQHYEFGYKIVELTETRFVRQSNRVMRTSFDTDEWEPGDAILFTEIFVPKE